MKDATMEETLILEDGLSYHGLIDRMELQRLQDEFCRAAGIFAFCLDKNGERLTEMSGDPGEKQKLEGRWNEAQLRNMLELVREGSAGELVIEELGTCHIKLAAVSVRLQGNQVINWIVFGVIADGGDEECPEGGPGFSAGITAARFSQALELLRAASCAMLGNRLSLEAILDNVGCAVYVRDAGTGRTLFTNNKLRSIFAKELKDGTFEGLIDQGVSHGKTSGTYEINHINRERWYELFYTEVTWVDGNKAFLSSLYDITDKKLYQKRIEQQAYTDFLTGLYNRLCCERDLAWHVEEARRNQETGALLYLDLDDFKHINDGLGHQYGDLLLKSISHSLQRVDGIRNTCYRMGGDEFVILIPPRHYSRFEQIVEDIRHIFNKPWYLKDADYYCTMSMGIVTFPDCGESVTELIKKADIAMYEAKKSGKNRLARYSDSIGSSSGRRLDMEKNMRDATAEGFGEFHIYFQPIIDVQEGETRCTGAEALIRWNNTKLGFVSPAEFIPLAEYLGLINPIGNHVLMEACYYCKKWNDSGYPYYKVNVNLSVVQLLQTDIVEIVRNTLEETELCPENLTLEVTESLAINDMERMKEILSSIKELGVKIALDDFGTGYSSLNHIREIPFDVIKVDQSFVKDLAEDAYSQSFIKLVAELAQTIGVSVCVEGIETLEQYKVLQGMKVRYIQGYYFDRPMPAEEFEEKYIPGLVKHGEIV